MRCPKRQWDLYSPQNDPDPEMIPKFPNPNHQTTEPLKQFKACD